MMSPYFRNRNKLEIYYQIFNSYNNSFPVIFVHGYGSSLAMFERQIPLLEKHYNLILMDAIGHGNSDKPEIEFQEKVLYSTIEDLKELINILDIQGSFGFVGHSMFGCAVAQQFTIYYPEKVEFLILLNGSLMILDSTIRNIFWNLLPQFTRMHFDSLPNHYLEKLIQQSIPYIIEALKPEEDEYKFTSYEIQLMSEKIEGDIFDLLTNFLNPASIMCPTLIIGAELDNFAPVYMSKEIYHKIQDSTLVIITMSGHFGLSQRYEQYNTHIISFLKNHRFIDEEGEEIQIE